MNYVIAGLGLALICTGGFAWVQTERLDASRADVLLVAGERDSAIAANAEFVAAAERLAAAAREKQAQLELLRRNYERRLAHVQKLPDDGCLDRALPTDVLSVLRADNPGTGETYCPAGP